MNTIDLHLQLLNHVFETAKTPEDFLVYTKTLPVKDPQRMAFWLSKGFAPETPYDVSPEMFQKTLKILNNELEELNFRIENKIPRNKFEIISIGFHPRTKRRHALFTLNAADMRFTFHIQDSYIPWLPPLRPYRPYELLKEEDVFHTEFKYVAPLKRGRNSKCS